MQETPSPEILLLSLQRDDSAKGDPSGGSIAPFSWEIDNKVRRPVEPSTSSTSVNSGQYPGQSCFVLTNLVWPADVANPSQWPKYS
jgi:hypothetical protein